MESAKRQHPNSREASKSKIQNASRFWNLGFGVSLVLGACELELLEIKP